MLALRIRSIARGLVAGALLGAALALPAVPAAAAPCTAGAFRADERPLIDSTAAPAVAPDPDVVVIRDGLVALGSCKLVNARMRTTKRGTKVKARWPYCPGVSGSVRLTLTLAPTCETLRGKLVTAAARKRFTATNLLPAPAVAVDPALVPAIASLPSPDGTERPVAAVRDDAGQQTQFVEDEIVVATDDLVRLQELLDRRGGVVEATLSPADYGFDGPTLHRVRIDPSRSDPANLPRDLRALNPERTGSLAVSSDAALRALAAMAGEAARGTAVGLNLVPLPSSLDDRRTNDGVGFGNAFDRNYLRANCRSGQYGRCDVDVKTAQNIGVTEAWRVLEASGRINNRVTVGVVDGGFGQRGDEDWTNWRHYTFTPLAVDPYGRNPFECGGSPCPWHGRNVADVIAARLDNDAGIAGVAGPVADLVTVLRSDIFDSVGGVLKAALEGARIVNMSFGTNVPALLTASVLPFNTITNTVRRGGVLLFASAGNENADVDAEDCAWPFDWPCWERAWYTPCENGGVICVGGLGSNVALRDPGSNYGAEEVDIFAPFNVLAGPDPAKDNVHSVSGTSVASPYAAGVAALIWAANPALGADDVERILLETAHPAYDEARSYVNAYGAVIRALGGTPPELRILEPTAGRYPRSFSGRDVAFLAAAWDAEDGEPSVVWTSSLDGQIGTGTSFTTDRLRNGFHTIRATATDSSGFTTYREVVIEVAPRRPSAEIRLPADGARVYAGQPVSFQAFAYDPDTPDGEPYGGLAVAWTSDRDGVLGWGKTLITRTCGGEGVGSCLQTVGPHVITLHVLGVSGGEASDTITLWVDPAPSDTPPTVVVTQPSADTRIFSNGWDQWVGLPYVDVWVSASASDREDGTIDGSKQGQWFAWWTNQRDLPGYASECESSPGCLGFTPSRWVRLYNDARCGAQRTHVLTVEVSDSRGNVATASRTLIVANGPC
jgi:subtilisin family serine protease